MLGRNTFRWSSDPFVSGFQPLAPCLDWVGSLPPAYRSEAASLAVLLIGLGLWFSFLLRLLLLAHILDDPLRWDSALGRVCIANAWCACDGDLSRNFCSDVGSGAPEMGRYCFVY